MARQCDVPYVVVPHGTLARYTFQYRRRTLKRLYYRFVDASTLRRAVAIQFTTRRERDEALRLGIDTHHAVIPHPYEPRFDEGTFPEHEGGPVRILFLARFHPKKNIGVVLEAVDRVRRDVPDIKLVLAGSGPDSLESQVRSQIVRLGLEKVVELPGFVGGEEKRRLLRTSSVFVLPSRQENFGISVVEAMDAGVPVVISRGVGLWPEVADSEAGIVVEPATPQEVAKALLTLLNDESERRRMGRSGRAFVRSTLDPMRIGRRLGRFYRAAADGGGAWVRRSPA